MLGAPDPLYIKAREVLLDALEALGPHRSSLVLVGAQAIYLHTGEADIAVAPFTTDADLIIDPGGLADDPILGDVLRAAGFASGDQPGQWLKDDARVDLMVPEAVAGAGRRGVRLGPHGNRAARKARGLEGALVDRETQEIASFDEGGRRFRILVAGPAALLVSKLHKLAERVEDPSRVKDKDALDILRLLRGVSTQVIAQHLRGLRQDPRSTEVTSEALQHLERLFARPGAAGSTFAARAAAGLEPEDTIRASCAALAEELLRALAAR
ncbi:MAG: GSU2403 family nucleotidyltransferase fold protein [Thermoanaerobaculia bacterium]